MRPLLPHLLEPGRGDRADRPAARAGGRYGLIEALLDPEGTRTLSPRGWNELLLEAREYGLLARLAATLEECGAFDGAPAKARSHMRAAAIAAQSSQTAVRFELNRILRALAGLDVPLVLLKGSAYVAAGLPAARGRFVGDLDLMVPSERIAEVERTLVERGWARPDLDPYDEHYYRTWTHEIPALQHPERDTPIDLHHTIVQLTSRVHPDARALFRDAVALDGGRLRVLAPADMVLHSALHLFNDEVGLPLRDLFDQHDLLVHFGARPQFWDELQGRARLHGLERPLFYMLRELSRRLGTPIPRATERAVRAFAPPRPVLAAMDWLFERHFIVRRGTALARALLLARAHWLRMPPALLARHLAIKTVRRFRQ